MPEHAKLEQTSHERLQVTLASLLSIDPEKLRGLLNQAPTSNPRHLRESQALH